MDRKQNLREQPGENLEAPGSDETSLNDGETPRGPQRAARQPQHSSGFTMFPPNESRRNQINAGAQKEEQEYQRWKEAHRPPPVHLNPEKLGGSMTLNDARVMQHNNLRTSKLQKKQLKKEELDKRKKQEEDEELQKKKNIQREKANLLEKKRQAEDERRREQLWQDHTRTNESFLQSVVQKSECSSRSAAHTPILSKPVETKPQLKSLEDVQLEHRRVNEAFLEKLQAKSRSTEKESKEDSFQEEHHQNLVSEHLKIRSQTENLLPTCLEERSELRSSGLAEDFEPQPKFERNLMELKNSFPHCTADFLKDILDQCNGDLEEAYTLLISTLN